MKVKIDGQEYEVAAGKTVLKICREIGINIPTLCYMEGFNEEAACSLCLVEVKGAKNLLRSCVTKVTEGMEVTTKSQRIFRARKTILELILANHPQDCLACERNQNCELQKLAEEMGITEIKYEKTRNDLPLDESSLSIIRDHNKCILCGRCVAACSKTQSVFAIAPAQRGLGTTITTYLDKGLGFVQCVNCGQCLLVCPTGAITERNEIDEVWQAISDPEKTVIVQTAPAVRAAIGETFGLIPGTLVTGKMTAALRRLGFDKVFDTQFTADLTIMEEGHELIQRVTNNGPLPLITSCSPGWIKFVEHFFPEALKNVSSCKSPQQMFGAVAKTYYAEKMQIDPEKLVVVSIMPCTAKKYEANRPEMDGAYEYWKQQGKKPKTKFKDVDYVLTTREAAKMIKQAGIDFVNLPDEHFDDPLGASTGAATIFGATGGVMEAALRTAYEVIANKTLPQIDLKALRGQEDIKTAEVDIAGTVVKVAVANGLSNARVLLEEVAAGRSPYHFIEIMCCPGGCIGGGGQPIPTNAEIRQKRAEALYREDAGMPIRKSHENPDVQKLYKEFLGKPLSEVSHHLLHTHYTKRE
jgi:NADH-quinone oxidoreductase subunit G/NADP-reducing hydrogenase subunit HndD